VAKEQEGENHMKISVLVFTSDFRGDHSTDIIKAHSLLVGETVEGLVVRLLTDFRGPNCTDHIELRIEDPSEKTDASK
jgi:hypothetical protein